MKKIWKRFIKALKKISLVDKFLILFMFILLIQSGYNLFANASTSYELKTIDVIVRTSSAAIFGYFLSGNFIKESATINIQTFQGRTAFTGTDTTTDSPKDKIGFCTSDIASDMTSHTPTFDASSQAQSHHCNKLQIIIVSLIGLFSLILLLVLRNFAENTSETSATVSQLRDFVSACVGFLVGCGKIQDL